MSGIAGIIHFDGAPVEPGSIEKLTEAMRRRGPDEQTHWVQGSVALGHCMLRTTPESLEEHQPLISQDKNLVLVWDGRLDNREELQRDLKAAGVTLRDDSDAELVLHSYAAWGKESPNRLLGDFAFAVWDARQQCLFCARDHMGARPFYYTLNDGFFAFASEDEALPSLDGVSCRPNEERIAYVLVPTFVGFGYAHSWMDDVWSLLPAQSMTVSPNRAVQINTYWQLEPSQEAQYRSDEECQQAFLTVFGEAVRCRMRSIGNISAMMSGGLDSASISAMVKRHLHGTPSKQFHTYSAISDHPETCVESQCIQSLTKDLDNSAHFVSVPSFTGMLNVQDLIDIAWSKTHPVDNSLLPQAMMCLAASRDGHRVMMHGVCGDLTTHVPYRYVAWLMWARHWRRAWHECRMASRNNNYLRGTSPLLLLLGNIWFAYIPQGIKQLVNRLQTVRTRSPLEHSLINQDFSDRLKLRERLRASRRQAGWSLTDIQQVHIRALSPPHGISSSLSGYDRVAGHYGVELRDPWGDRRVVEFFLRLPLQYKVRDGWTKYLVRTAFTADLPPEVRWRVGKENLGWNFACRLMDETHALVSQTIEQRLDSLERYVDLKAVRERFKKYCRTKGNSERESIYEIMTLAFWLKRLRSH